MKSWLLSALLLSSTALAGEPISFHDSNAQAMAAEGAVSEAWLAQCAAGGEFAMLAPAYAPDPRMSRQDREAAERKFDRKRFEAIAQETYDRVVAELPQGKLTLCVDFAHPNDNFARDQMGGVMALTAGSGRIIVKVHPDSDWAKLLPYVLAHELHHSYWATTQFDASMPFTLGEYLVFEGRADNFLNMRSVRTRRRGPMP